ncbi:arsenate reductase (glutaredoxin) [Xanthomonas sp. 60]
MAVTIWHNAACSNSRGALQLIRDAGIEPTIVDYAAHPPTAAKLRKVLADAAMSPMDLIRSKEAVFEELGLAQASDDARVAAMVAHPQLINRPVVITPKGTRLCRPPTRVLDLL